MEKNPATGEPMHDMPDMDELYQGDMDTPLQPVPTEITNVVRVDQLPRMFGMMDTIPLAATASARKVVGDDPRRAQVTLWVTGADVVIASNQGSAQARQGAILQSGLAVPVHFAAQSELWVRPVAGAAAEAQLSVATELWAR